MPIRAVDGDLPPTSTPISQATFADPSRSRLVFISGQVGRKPGGEIAGPTLTEQLPAAYANVRRVVEAAGGTVKDVVQLRTYLVSTEDLPLFRTLRDSLNRDFWGSGPYPANTLLVVAALALPEFRIEIEATAAIDLEPRA